MPLAVKYLVRIREVENDVRTERTYEFLSAKDAVRLKRQAEKYGFFGQVLRVRDWKQLERV